MLGFTIFACLAVSSVHGVCDGENMMSCPGYNGEEECHPMVSIIYNQLYLSRVS